MNARLAVVTLLVAAVAVPLAGPVAGAGFADVLDTPAQASTLASRGLMQAVARAGNRLVAVGQRGHVVVSTDEGKTWKQSMIPVSSDLTAVYFVDAKDGWAVGHDGVVLHTADGGESWQLQLDGRRANDMLLGAMERKVAAEPASESAKALLAEAKRYKEQGADKPFLDVWFADAAEWLRRRRVQPHLPYRRRREDVGAVVRPHRQSQILQSVFDPSRGGGCLHRGRGGTRAEARHRPHSGSGRSRFPTKAASSVSPTRATPCSPSVCAATSGAATTAASRGPRSRPVFRRRSSARRPRPPARSSWPTPAGGSPRAATAGVPLLQLRSSHRCRSPASLNSATGDSCWRVRAESRVTDPATR